MILPNQLTVMRIILTPVFLFLFLQDSNTLKQISVIVFLIAAITDWYDGWLARKFNYITSWGKFMDPLADKILTSAAFIGFVIIDFIPLWMVIVIIVRDFLITGLRSYADFKKQAFYTSRSAKVKTFIQMVFLYYLLIVYVLKTLPTYTEKFNDYYVFLSDKRFIYFFMLFVTLLTAFTGITYIFKNRFMIRELYVSKNK